MYLFLKLNFRYTFDVVKKDKHTYIKMHRLLTITLNFNIILFDGMYSYHLTTLSQFIFFSISPVYKLIRITK